MKELWSFQAVFLVTCIGGIVWLTAAQLELTSMAENVQRMGQKQLVMDEQLTNALIRLQHSADTNAATAVNEKRLQKLIDQLVKEHPHCPCHRLSTPLTK